MDILINPPKSIPITKKEFKDFSYYELACFWCNWRIAFLLTDEGNLNMYTGKESIVYKCMKNYRFKNVEWYEISSAEMYYGLINKNDKLFDLIINKLDYLIMK